MPAALVTIIVCLLLAESAWAQIPWSSVFMGQVFVNSSSNAPPTPPWSPTNLPNLYTLWCGPLTTNGATVTWSDQWTNALHITNSAATSKWPVDDGTKLNGSNTIVFNGTSDYLVNTAFTNTSGLEIWYVLKYLGTLDSANHYYGDSATTAGRAPHGILGSVNKLFISGSATVAVAYPTNLWWVYRFSFMPGGLIQTNNVTAIFGGSVPNTVSGYTLGSAYYTAGSAYANIRVAAVWTFSSTNSQSDATLNYQWATNTFGFVP